VLLPGPDRANEIAGCGVNLSSHMSLLTASGLHDLELRNSRLKLLFRFEAGSKFRTDYESLIKIIFTYLKNS